MIYLASVYSIHAKTNSRADKMLREQRYQFAMEKVANLTFEGLHVFSPIVYNHPVSTEYDFPKDYDWWKPIDRHFLDFCDEVWVLKMPHWKDSVGITDEIAYAKSQGKKVTYIACPEYAELVI